MPGRYPDVAAVLADDSVRVVHVCTPNALHVPQADAALRAGKHVVCEKPLATSVADAERLTALAERAGLHERVIAADEGHSKTIEMADGLFLSLRPRLRDRLPPPVDASASPPARVPFSFVRVDRAGNLSKRQSATGFHTCRVGRRCWFSPPGRRVRPGSGDDRPRTVRVRVS